jgi:hypothetical protein
MQNERTMQCKEWNTIAEEIIQNKKGGLESEPTLQTRTQAFENKRN